MKGIRFVGLDVAKETIAVAVAAAGRLPAEYMGTMENAPEAVRRLMGRLGPRDLVRVCYEAGPTGYGLHRQLTDMGITCTVIAPSLIPRRPGDRVKTDRRDAVRLAELHRAGLLVPVWVPDEADESLRDLVRAREDAKQDQLRARHRLSKFLLRHDLRPQEKLRPWGAMHRRWLDSVKLGGPAGIALSEYLHTIDEIQGRVSRLEAAIHEEAVSSARAPIIQALQALRGVREVTATSLVAEVGAFSRFATARQFMGYSGLVPREYSSGSARHQGGITKTGNAHIRRVVVESAWAYRHRPAVTAPLRARQEGQSPRVRDIAWRAQNRLHHKYMHMVMRGKGGGVAAAATARELLGFIWAIGCEAERSDSMTSVS